MCPFVTHIILQILDGVFTYAGVMYLGIGAEIEGNALLKTLMYILGPGTALVLVKGSAISALLYVRSRSRDLVMLRKILSRINLLYMLAVGMWAYVFLR